MAQNMDRQELAIRFLLGDLSEDEEKTIGRRYLSEIKGSEELEIAEDELIDRYVRRELSTKDSSRFEMILLSSPRLRERVEFAKILVKRVSASPLQAVTSGSTEGAKPRKKKGGGFVPWGGFWGTTTGMKPALRFALTASVVLMLIAGAVLVFIWTRRQAESQRLAQEQQRQQREAERTSEQGSNENRAASNQAKQEEEQRKNVVPEAQQQRQKQPRRQGQRQSFAFFLAPTSGTRGVGGPQYPTLNIPLKAPSVQLNLDVERGDHAAYSLYNASLENTDDNRVIARENNLKTFPHRGRKHIRLEVPRGNLTDGLYIVHIDGVTASGQTENFNDYIFRVRVR